MRNIEILYEDDSAIIINKPSGLAVQGGKSVKNSVDKLLAAVRNPPPLLVHRLDKDTSGVLLTAKTKEAAAMFSRIFNNSQCTEHNAQLKSSAVKQYIAVVAGCLPRKEGVIETQLEVHGKMKKSLTKFKMVNEGGFSEIKYSVLEIELGTGRMHQIRRHLAMTGCPVLGDDKYGNFAVNKRLRKAGVKRLLLHASRLVIKECNIDVVAPLPEYFSLGSR